MACSSPAPTTSAMSVASTRAETFDGFDELGYSITEAPAAPTLSKAEVADALCPHGWIPEVDGPYAEPWRLYWGKECVTETLAPHSAWVHSFARTSEKSTWDEQVQTLLPILIVPEGDEELALPSCEYISTPWVDELGYTRGRIVVGDELIRINDQLCRNPHGRLRAGVVVLGQAGVGKTYLAYYLLIRQLAAQKTVFFSPKHDLYFLFHPAGVFRKPTLRTTTSGYAALRSILPRRPWVILDTAPEDGEPDRAATREILLPIQLCRPETKHYEDWQERSVLDFLAVDAPSPEVILAEALVQADVRPRKDDLGRLLQHIHDFGPRPRICFRELGSLKRKRLELDDYIKSLAEGRIESIATRSRRRWDFDSCLHCDERPDILVLRCDPRGGIDALIPTVSSRYTIDRLRHHLTFDSMMHFRSMNVVRQYYEGLENTRDWLFDQLCHFSLSAYAGNSGVLRLTPCSPSKAGALRLEHLLVHRAVRHFDQHPPPFDPSIYYIHQFPPDEALHAIAYVLPSFGSDQSAKAGPSTMPQRVTRLAVRRAATEAVKGHRSSATSPISTRSRVKHGRLAALPEATSTPSCLVVFFQMVMFGAPKVAANDWARVESTMARIMADDISMMSATYCMVFVTLRGKKLDARMIPRQWSKRMTLYHLEVDLQFEFESN